MEDGFTGIVKATPGRIYIIKYFVALEINGIRETLKKQQAGFKGFPFSIMVVECLLFIQGEIWKIGGSKK